MNFTIGDAENFLASSGSGLSLWKASLILQTQRSNAECILLDRTRLRLVFPIHSCMIRAYSATVGRISASTSLPFLLCTNRLSRTLGSCMPAASPLRLFGICKSFSIRSVGFRPSQSRPFPIAIHNHTITTFSNPAVHKASQHYGIINRNKGPRNVVKTVYINESFSSSTPRKMATNGDVRSKRKNSPVQVLTRPSKILRHDSYPGSTENGQPVDEDMYSNTETDGDDRMSLPPIAATADTAEWQATIEKVVRNVVSIHFCQTCSFDTDPAISSEATGFVVDAAKGYILTNRHVVGAGPFWGYCIFDNHEEVRKTKTSMLLYSLTWCT